MEILKSSGYLITQKIKWTLKETDGWVTNIQRRCKCTEIQVNICFLRGTKELEKDIPKYLPTSPPNPHNLIPFPAIYMLVTQSCPSLQPRGL